MRRIRIFDTTLRDGEQAPGFAMTKEEKVAFAKQLQKLGVDVIEAGFPVVSPKEFEAVSAIASECQEVEVCALARCNPKDIECAVRALEKATHPRIHVFIATSEIHMRYKLKMTQQEVLEKAVQGIKLAKKFTPRVEFSAEDATRSDRKFLVEIFEAAIHAGADVINVPDTVGFMTTKEYGDLIAYLKTHIKNSDRIVISAHCHDDLGMATANSLMAVLKGAGQVECTINGIGERAGNAALEEVVMAIKTKSEVIQAQTAIHTPHLLGVSRFLSEITGISVPPNKAIVGKNAFAHGSGIHQHGMLTHQQNYEIMNPKEVGFGSSEIVLSKHSGKHALKHRLHALGIDVGDALDELFVLFKHFADRKKCVFDEDLLALVQQLPHKVEIQKKAM